MDVNDETRQAVAKEMSEAVAGTIAAGIAKGIAKGIALFIGFLIFIALGGVVVLLLWNWLVPSLFGLREITLWEALGLIALSRILFGGFGHRGGSHDGPRHAKREWWKKGDSPPVDRAPQ